jgi:hypothetical protein
LTYVISVGSGGDNATVGHLSPSLKCTEGGEGSAGAAGTSAWPKFHHATV